MSELTVTVPYKPLHKDAVVSFCVLWGLIEIAAICWYFQHPELFWATRIVLILLGAAAFAYPPFVLVTFYREGGTLTANSDGLILPPDYMGFGDIKSIKWAEVKTIDLISSDKSGQVLQLRTTSGTTTRLETKSMPPVELEKLFLAMELWLSPDAWTERAIIARDGLQISSNDSTFTKLWETELRRRFSATTFVPHEPGKEIIHGIRVLKQLAFGGFSAVYLAENADLEKIVVKELVVQSSSPEVQAKALEQFDREARLLAKIRHEQIARVIDHFVHNENTYMVLEYIEGENLREFVRRKGALDEQLVWDCAEQMAKVLSYLHSLNPIILHRDFTPDNLVIGNTGKITVIDFGAANEFSSSATGTLVGKQAYMPLEQIRGKAEPRSDLYSLGCVMHWLLTGTEPEPLSVCHPQELLPKLSNKINSVVEKLTALEPADRYASASELLELIQQHGKLGT
jgi:tRNA A-37 threonylcarbamoyl transferase component Bud32